MKQSPWCLRTFSPIRGGRQKGKYRLYQVVIRAIKKKWVNMPEGDSVIMTKTSWHTLVLKHINIPTHCNKREHTRLGFGNQSKRVFKGLMTICGLCSMIWGRIRESRVLLWAG